MTTADEERAAIVAWLRRQAVGFAETAEQAVVRGDERSARDRFAGKICCENAANSIERGEHLRGGE